MFPLNPLQAKGVFTFLSSITMSFTPVVEPLLTPTSEPELTPPPAIVEEGEFEMSFIDLSVPFSSQAPEGNWEQPYYDACEEASILMVDRFYKGRTENKIDSQEAKQAILNVVKIKEGAFGPSYDENLIKMGQIIDLINSNWIAEIKEDPTLEEIKNELRQNHPVIAPVAYFPNPNYRSPVDYHMFVITGFNDEKGVFILNDPGTQYGDGSEFAYQVVMDSLHDLNKPDYEAGEKRVLFTKLKD